MKGPLCVGLIKTGQLMVPVSLPSAGWDAETAA